MPDAHWLTEARVKGTRVVVIACEYSATSTKADDVIVVRPGTTPALGIGLAHVIMKEKLYDADYVKRFTDLPLLVRMDTPHSTCKAQDVFGGAAAALSNQTHVMAEGEKEPPPGQHRDQLIPGKLRDAWGDYVWWDQAAKAPRAITRDEVGAKSKVGDPLLEGAVEVTLKDGTKVRCRPVFDLVYEYAAHCDPKTVEDATWAPAAVGREPRAPAREEPRHDALRGRDGPEPVLQQRQQGPRPLPPRRPSRATSASSTGNVGSYAGNYRVVALQRRAAVHQREPVRPRARSRRSPRGRSSTGRPSRRTTTTTRTTTSRSARRLLTGSTHIPCPTKSLWFANANSILGNVKWHYNTVVNVLPKIEMIAVQRVVVVDVLRVGGRRLRGRLVGRAEVPRHDGLRHEPVPERLPADAAPAHLRDARRHRGPRPRRRRRWRSSPATSASATCWKFVKEKKVEVYLQRILDASANTKGYRIEELEAKAKDGNPVDRHEPDEPEVRSATSRSRTRGPGTRSPGASSSTARSPSSSRPARTCPSTASRSTRRSTSRTSSSRRSTRRSGPTGPESYGVVAGRPLVRGAPGPQRREDVGGDEEDRRTRSRSRATSSSSTRRSTGTARTRSRSTRTWSRCSSGRSATSTGTTSGRRS